MAQIANNNSAAALGTVLCFLPNTGSLRKSSKTMDVLWPALAYKVIVPLGKARLNLFERMVLKLCQAGVQTPSDVDQCLAIGSDLATILLAQLEIAGFLDARRDLTEEGLEALQTDGQQALNESAIANVFWDPVSRRLWPRMVTGNLADYAARGVADDPKGYGQILYSPPVVGSHFQQIAKHFHCHWERYEEVRPPSTIDILRACRQHVREQAAWGRVGERPLLELSAPDGSDHLVDQMQRVVVLPGKPQRVHLATVFYMPTAPRGGNLWQAYDPFGLGPSGWLRQIVTDLLERNPDHVARGWIDYIERLADRARPEVLARAESKAYLKAEEAFRRSIGSPMHESQTLRDRLIEAEIHIRTLEGAGKKDLSKRDRDWSHGQAMVELHAAVEELLAVVQGQFGPPAAARLLRGAVGQTGKLLKGIARSLGFDDGPAGPVLPGPWLLTAGRLQSVADYGGRDLPCQYGVALLAAQEAEEHPMRELARTFPDSGGFLATLKRARDRAVHGSDWSIDKPKRPARRAGGDELPSPSPLTAAQARQDVHRMVRVLLPSAEASAVGDRRALAGEGATELLTYRRQLRARAEREVAGADAIGSQVRALPELCDALVEMCFMRLQVQALQEGGLAPERIARRLQTFIFSACAAAETALRLLLRACGGAVQAVAPDLRDTRQLVPLALSKAGRAGFTMTEDGDLPAALASVEPNRVVAAARGKATTLGATVMALVLCIPDQGEHPVRLIAQSYPTFLLAAARLAEARGHGNILKFDIGQMELLETDVFLIAKAVTDILA